MNESSLQEEEIFKLALKIKSAEARETYLKQVCGENHALFDRLLTLLQAHDEESSFLEKPLSDAIVTEIGPVTEQPGDKIGPFKLLQQIGEGGFGVVYMAEQTKPVRRKVALKIIKPGMDSKEVIARFEAERQALALMDHPNIAKVLDAGSTESGRPYFVMELVKGVPLTHYCDKNHLSGTERLKLFVKVCHAIQHAHQKGVIHRDLKPSNIMVTLHDGKPVPKVIDFGVSKALSQQLTEKTLFTAYGQMVGTPAYMSPEQAEMSGLDIDTRSDVYSLGVLLYELLTGSTPFDSKRLRSAGYAEMQRIIREEEPPKPSTRVTTMGEEASIVSSNRGTDARKLSQMIRGELDWIVMKALDKERNRRYETANGFAADIERFLAHEPVEACPPSAAYRFRKFARRNKVAFVATAVSMGVLLAIAIGSTIAAKQFRDLAQTNAKLALEKEAARKTAVDAEAAAKLAQKDAEQARDQEEKQRIHAEQQRERAEANYALARSAVDQFLNRVTENQLLTVPGMQPLREELLTEALNFYDRFARDDSNADEMKLELARANFRIGAIRGELQRTKEDRSAYQKSLQLYEELIASGEDSTEIRFGLAKVNFVLEQYDRVIEICQKILETDPDHVESLVLLGDTYNNQGVAHQERAESAAALECFEKSLVFRESLVKKFPDNPDYLAGLGGTINNIGVMLSDQGQTDEALEMFNESIRLSDQAYQISPQNLRWGNWLCLSLRNVATKLQEKNGNEEALEYFGRVAQVRRQLMTQNPGIPRLRGQLVFALKELGDFQRRLNLTEEANRTHRSATELLESVPRNTPEEMIELALVYGSLATPPKGVHKDLSEQQLADQNYYSEQAWDLVRTAIDKGYRNVAILALEPSLRVLRERQDFQELMEKLEQFLLADSVIQRGMENNLQGSNDLSDLDKRLSSTQRIFSDPLEHEKTLAKLGTAIGVVHIGLEDYQNAEQSLQESMERYKQLIVKSPHTRELKLRLLAVRTYLGEIRWHSGRLPEAHAMFSTLLDELATFPGTPDLDPELATLRILAERKICRYYGEIGLWELAVKYAVQNLRERRVQDPLWDSRFAVLLIGQSSLKDYREYCRLYYEQFKTSPSTERDPWENAHLIYTCGLVENPDIPIDERIELGRKLLQDDYTSNRWVMLSHALTLYRAEKYQEALDILPYPDSGLLKFGAGYLHALIQFQLGDRENANKSLYETEQSLMSYCSAPFDEAARKLANPFSERWHELAYSHALRAEAYRTIRGVSDPPDTGLQLVQARAYQLIGQKELAQQHLAQVEQQFLRSLGETGETNSSISSIAAALAEQLLIQHDQQRTWSTLRPATMISQGGATLMLQDDSSILASGKNPLSDGYTITVPVKEPMSVSWIRLEALTHESLPRQGPGRDPTNDPGNFGMHRFQVSLRDSNLGVRPLVLSRVTTDDVNYNFPVTLTHWNFSGQIGQSQSVYYQLESPVQLDAGSELILEMQFSPHPDWPRQNLGCFRLSVSDDPGVWSISDPFARLAATYDTLGDEQNVQKILVAYPSSGAAFAEYLVSIREWDRGIHEFSKLIEANSTDISLLIKRATAYATQDQWDLAQADWEQVLKITGDNPAMLLDRAKFYAIFGKWKLAQADALRAVELVPQETRTVFEFCQQAERWEEAAIFGLRLIDREPDYIMTWLNVAPVIALADQTGQYTRFCERMLERFSDETDVVTIERLCHAVLIEPETVDVSRVPGEVLAKAMEENQNLQAWFPQWGWSSLALWRYRNGEPELAIECAQKARKLADTQYVVARSLALIALSQHELQNEDAAREALEELNQLVSRFSYKETNNHDQLVPKILLREAEAKIGRKAANSPAPASGATESSAR